MNREAMFRRASDEWMTPLALYLVYHQRYGFTIDGAATAENTHCGRFWDATQDALAQSWANETVWLNPPYSRIAPFLAKARAEQASNATTVLLVPARTDTRWFHDHLWDRRTHHWQTGVGPVEFLKGRVRFERAGGAPAMGAPFPSMVVVLPGYGKGGNHAL